jgi:hypothetical protein
MALDVVLDAVIVEQRIVHIDQKNNGVRQRHSATTKTSEKPGRLLKKISEARRAKTDERRRTLVR